MYDKKRLQSIENKGKFLLYVEICETVQYIGGILMKIARKVKIDIRLSEEEKLQIERQAARKDMSVSEYARKRLLAKNRGLNNQQSRAIGKIVVSTQQLLNYVQEKYVNNEDEELECKVDRLWKEIRSL